MWPDGSYEGWGYDAAGNRTSQTAAGEAAQSTIFGYDPLNRPQSASYWDGWPVGYTYTPTGQRQSVSDNRWGTTTYSYDGRDRVVSINPAHQWAKRRLQPG